MSVISRFIIGTLCLVAGILLSIYGMGIPPLEAFIGVLAIIAIGIPMERWLTTLADSTDSGD